MQDCLPVLLFAASFYQILVEVQDTPVNQINWFNTKIKLWSTTIFLCHFCKFTAHTPLVFQRIQ